MRRVLVKTMLSTYSPVLILCCWEALAWTGTVDEIFFPRPSTILLQIGSMFTDGTLPTDVAATLFRVLSGLFLGGIPAVFLGAAMARNPWFHSFLYPIAIVTYPLPKIALIPLFVLIFGYGEFTKILLVSLGAFYLILFNTYFGVLQIESIHFDIAFIGNYSRLDRWRYIVMPGALPQILHGVKLAVGICLILIVAAEFVGSSSGLGYRIWFSWETFHVERMFGALFVLAVVGGLLNALLHYIERVAIPWRR